jgi:YD repeat-containing protein
MKKLCFFIACFAMIGTNVHAQNGGSSSNYTPPEVIPPTPEVASLLKFTETPVSYHTGLPNISIPIANLSGRDLSATVAISYHAGGHRVDEESTWVGLGWNLSAGGHITRTVRGRPDDTSTYGYIHTPYTVESMLEECSTSPKTIHCKSLSASNGYIGQFVDFEPDEYSFSGLGISGRFMFDQRRNRFNPYGRIINFENRDVKIIPNIGYVPDTINGVPFNGSIDKIIGWTITDTNGTQYNYSIGNTFRRSITTPVEAGAPTFCNNCPNNSESYIETWDLTSVVSVTGDTLTVNYTRPNVNNWERRNEETCSKGQERAVLYTASYTANQGLPDIDTSSPNSYDTSYTKTERSFTQISSISTSQGTIEFIRSTINRLDTQSPKQALDSIIVRNNFGTPVKKIKLKHSYFTSPDPNVPVNLSTTGCFVAPITALTKRLKLDEVEFIEVGTTTPKKYSYKLDYNENIDLPYKWSPARDHWGYYNGAVNNRSMIPPIRGIHIPFAGNRSVDSLYTQAAILQNIEFPEGGRTNFTYENNRKGDKAPINGFVTEKIKVKADPMTNHQITTNGNLSSYRFFQTFTIPTDAVSVQGQTSKTEVNYDGFTSRCADVAQIYGIDDQVCNTMIFKIYNNNSNSLLLTKNIWEFGTLLLDKEQTYRIEIEMDITSTAVGLNQTEDDYNFLEHSTYVDLNWRKNSTIISPPDFTGGLRIKEIKNYGEDGLVSRRSYLYEEGYSLSKPSYLKYTTYETLNPIGGVTIHQNLELISQSWIPLITTQAKHQGYGTVKEVRHEVLKDTLILGHRSDNDLITSRSYLNPVGYMRVFPSAPYEPIVKRDEIEVEAITDKRITNYQYIQYSFRQYEHIYGYQSSKSTQADEFDASIIFSGTLVHFGSDIDNSIQCGPYSDCKLYGSVYQIAPSVNLVSKQTSQVLEGSQILTQVTDNFYQSIPNHYNTTQVITTGSNGKVTEQRMFYPHDVNSGTLISENRINTLLETATIKDSLVIQRVRNKYALDHGNFLPKSINAQKLQDTLNPTFRTDTTLEERMTYHSYYPSGKVREVSQTKGTRIVYVWGYEESSPIAKIENATFAQVETAIATLPSAYNALAKIQTFSNDDQTRTVDTFDGSGNKIYQGKEGNLREAFELLRAALPKAMITSLTYDPLIGTTSVTDPRGNVIYYQYDGFNRLISIKDRDGNIVSENTYHYKN